MDQQAPETNTVRLREHLEKRICELEKRFEIKLESMQSAIGVTTKENDRRMTEMNELRKEVVADRGQFVLIPIYQLWHDITESRITKMETKSATRGEVLTIGLILAGLVVGIIKLLK